MRYLLNVVNTYRVPTVDDALALREELQEMPAVDYGFLLFRHGRHRLNGSVHFMAFHDDSRERAGRTYVFASAAADAAGFVYGRHVK